MTPTIGIVDHGAGNLVSVRQALATVGAQVVTVYAPPDLEGLDGVVLPGVGATAPAMARLRTAGLVDPLRSWDGPLLGICVGMQLLFEGSDEDGAEGLGLLAGWVTRIPEAPRLPHMGWNDLDVERPDPLLADLGPDDTVYFVHSYAPRPADDSTVVARTSHGRPFVSMVRAGAVAGVQFHPERSGPVGLRILRRFVGACEGRRAA